MTDRRDPSESGGLLARLEVAEREINRLRDFQTLVAAKLSEYDKERSLAGRLFWPVIVALLTAAVLGAVALLLRLNGMFG
jgi:hypothetical protein